MANLPITRNEAVELLKSMDQQASDINHYLETEAIMKALAKRFNEDVEYWGMLGLLHDVDWALTKSDWKEHCARIVFILCMMNTVKRRYFLFEAKPARACNICI